MNRNIKYCGLAAMVCVVVSAPAFSATSEEISVRQEAAFTAVNKADANVSAAEKAVPASAKPSSAFFMNEAACAALDRRFIIQPSLESAGNMFRPCVAAIGKAYNLPVMLWQEKDFTIYIGKDGAIPPYGRMLSDELSYELAKRGKQVFGHPVTVIVGWPIR